MNKFLFVFSVFACAQVFAWGPHDDERAAWGGNGGWWGNSQNDWYGEYGTIEERRGRGNPYAARRGYNYNGYYYNNHYPYGGQHYYDNDVDGGALYFNFR